MDGDDISGMDPVGPDESLSIEQRLRKSVDELICFIGTETGSLQLLAFERALWLRIAHVYRLCVALFLALRNESLELQPWLGNGWRVRDLFATRTIKTLCGAVEYGRAYLERRGKGGGGWFPLDAALGITRDRFSWRVIDLVTQLATRVSYSAARGIVQAMIGWSPSTEAIERLVIGLGSRATAFMETVEPPEDEGEVLVIEVDGKAVPMATEEELAARRKRRKHRKKCRCGCQRHRGRTRRRGRKKPRKKRGHNSKNGRSATLVAMYTLRRGEDGKLHGPIHKKIWGRFGTRKAMLEWIRGHATRRGFDPETERVVQIVIDGEKCFRERLNKLFPNAIFTLDLRHAQERLWKAGRVFHAEGSQELEQWVEPFNELLVSGRINKLLKRLRSELSSIAKRGPNTRSKRTTLEAQIRFFEERHEMMRYDEYRREDLVLATGVIEGACRYVVGERLDCSGMRWTLEGAERLLQLRCIELNGDWESFLSWAADQYTAELHQQKIVKIRSHKHKRASPKKAA